MGPDSKLEIYQDGVLGGIKLVKCRRVKKKKKKKKKDKKVMVNVYNTYASTFTGKKHRNHYKTPYFML